MQVSHIVYDGAGQGEGWRVSWNAAGYCCSVSHLGQRDFAAIRNDAGEPAYFPEHVDEQKMFSRIDEAYAFFHHVPQEWRRRGADHLFNRIDPAKYPGLLEPRSVSSSSRTHSMER